MYKAIYRRWLEATPTKHLQVRVDLVAPEIFGYPVEYRDRIFVKWGILRGWKVSTMINKLVKDHHVLKKMQSGYYDIYQKKGSLKVKKKESQLKG